MPRTIKNMCLNISSGGVHVLVFLLVKTMMKQRFLILLALILVSCSTSHQGQPVSHGTSVPSGEAIPGQPPDEPMLNLAYRAAIQVESGLREAGLPMQLRMLPLDNGAGLPDEAVQYLQGLIVTRLQVFGITMPGDASVRLEGAIYWLRDQLVYGFKLRKGDQMFYSDSVSVPRDQRLENTIAQFSSSAQHHQHHHAEALIPTPVAQLQEAPLDVSQICRKGAADCEIVLLYPDRIETLNWKTMEHKVQAIPSSLFSATRSRAPSGKILNNGDGFVVLSNDLNRPIYFDAELIGPISPSTVSILPAAAPGLNSYSLGDGKFWDFEPLADGGMAVVETNRRLSLAREGTLTTASNPAGGALAAIWPAIYTSAPVLPGDPDSVQKFVYQDGNLSYESSKLAVGSICDLAVTDLNRDGIPELLVTVQRNEGVFIEVWEPF